MSKYLDFTLPKFRQLCSAMKGGYNFITMDEYVTAGDKLPERFVLMRHDIDGSVKDALQIARIVEEFGKTTDHLIKLIENSEISNFYIILHPERWKSNVVNWSLYWLQDTVFNSGKKVLTTVKK
jgi:hypothetical protein